MSRAGAGSWKFSTGAVSPGLGQSLLLDCEDVRTRILGGPGVARGVYLGREQYLPMVGGKHFNILIIVLTILGLICYIKVQVMSGVGRAKACGLL